MSYKITDECILCGACAPECPVEAISDGDTQSIIDADKCIECKGHFDEPQCKSVCPVDAVEHMD
ncbi:MAG: 4Fe-4S binding protein [Chloroflexota bacterium]